MRRRRPWKRSELAVLRRLYPTTPTKVIAWRIHRSVSSIYNTAHALGLKKRPDIVLRQNQVLGRRLALAPASIRNRFPKGLVPWNKGAHYAAGGRSPETRFRKGNKPQTWKPVGTEVIRDGQLWRKISDDLRPSRFNWRPVSVLVWEAAHGPVPKGCVVTFKQGKHSTDAVAITVDVLELISRAENMRRNSYHTNFPPVVRRLIQLRGALNRQINRRSRREEQDRRPA